MKKYIALFVLISVLACFLNITVSSAEASTFEKLSSLEDDFILRMRTAGIPDEMTELFLNDIDAVVDSFQASIYEQDLDAYFITVLLQIMQKEEHIPILVAFDMMYQEEIIYMLETRLVPECMYTFKMVVFYDKLIFEVPDDYYEDDHITEVPPIEDEPEIVPPVEVKPEVPLPFDDLEGYEWAVESIVYLYENGVVKGTGEKIFEPEKNITREEFIKMIVSALLRTDPVFDREFSLSTKDKWYHSYMASAEFFALTQGIFDEEVFKDGVYITRQDMTAIAYRAALRADITLPDIKYSTDFLDMNSCSYYSVQAIKELQEADIIHGMGNNKFEPHNTTTRAEAAKIIHSLMLIK